MDNLKPFKKFSLLKNSETQTTDRTIMDNSEPKEEQISESIENIVVTGREIKVWKKGGVLYIDNSELESKYLKLEEENKELYKIAERMSYQAHDSNKFREEIIAYKESKIKELEPSFQD